MSSDIKKLKKHRAGRGVVVDALGEVNRKIYRFVRDGAVGRYLSGYDKTCERFEKSFLARKLSERKSRRNLQDDAQVRREKTPEELEQVGIYDPASVPRSFRNRFSKAFDSSRLVHLMCKVKKWILYTPLVSYGVLLFGFALFMLITQTLTLFFTLYNISLPSFLLLTASDDVLIIAYMIAAVVLMAVSLVLIFAREGSLYSFMAESAISGYLLRNFMGIRAASVKNRSLKRHNGRAFALGMVLGLITFFVSPYLFFCFVLVVIFSAMVINIPEFGLVSLLFMLPFITLFEHPTVTTLLLLTLVLFSSLIKLLRGKRTFRFEPADLFVLLFLLLVLFGGIVTTGGMDSFHTAATYALLGLVYFSVTLLVKNEEWLNRCLNALMLSSSVVSVVGIAEWILGRQSNVWQDNQVFASLAGRVVSFWENPNVLAEYLIVSLFVSLGCLIGRKTASQKTFSLISLALSASCLVLTWSRGAWVGAAAVLILMLLILSYKTIPWVVLLAAGGVVAFVFLPDTFVERVRSIVTFSDSSVLYRVNIWKGCAALARKCFLTGVGVGSTAFTQAYDGFALSGIEAAPHAHNLYLQILLELGIMGLIVFLILILMIVRSAFSLFRVRSFEQSNSVTALALLSALAALLLNGMTDYIWYNYRIYFLFFAVLGLITATRRIGMGQVERPMTEPDACDRSFTLTRKKKTKKRTTS